MALPVVAATQTVPCGQKKLEHGVLPVIYANEM